MKRRVTSIEIIRNGGGYILSMVDNAITDMVYIPRDYNGKEIVELLSHSIPISSEKDTICYDEQGLGIMISDATIHNEDFRYKDNMKPLNYKDINGIAGMLDIAEKQLIDYALNNKLDSFGQMEFKKLCNEINNLEIEQGYNGLRLVRQDKAIDNARAICFLQCLYINKINGL